MMQFAFQNSLPKVYPKMGDFAFFSQSRITLKAKQNEEKILSREASYKDQQSCRKLKLYKNLYTCVDQKCLFYNVYIRKENATHTLFMPMPSVHNSL